jgi:hypothetical protein
MLYKLSMNKNPLIYCIPWPMCSTSTVLRSACNELVQRIGVSTGTDTHSKGDQRKYLRLPHCFQVIDSLHMPLLRFCTWYGDTRSILHRIINTIIVNFNPISEKLVSVALNGSIFLFRFCKSVHHHTFNWINQPDATNSQVYYLSFKYSSTYFGHPHAHRQDLQQLQ